MKLFYSFFALFLYSLPVIIFGQITVESHTLFAGQHMNAGEILISNNSSTLTIKYSTNDQFCLTETHLSVKADVSLIKQKKGNPIPGKMEHKGTHNCESTVTYQIPLSFPQNSEISIAAHAVVAKKTYNQINFDDFELDLPSLVQMAVAYPGVNSYYFTTIFGSNFLSGVHEGFCVDLDRVIYPGRAYSAEVYSSYDLNFSSLNLVDRPENMDFINYIVNAGYIEDSNFTSGDVQKAIWTLIDDRSNTSSVGPWTQENVDLIVADALANGLDFVPQCGQKVVVVLNPVIDNTTTAQVTFISVRPSCTYSYDLEDTETAWGDGVDFSGKNWATYILYTIK